jgi:hypothetical protein
MERFDWQALDRAHITIDRQMRQIELLEDERHDLRTENETLQRELHSLRDDAQRVARIFSGPIIVHRAAALQFTLRILADGLFKAVSGTLEGPDIEDLLEKAGLIAWTTFDSANPAHQIYDLVDINDGDRIWLKTAFARELLKHEDLPAPPSECEPGSIEPSDPPEAPPGQKPPAPE